MSELLTMPRQYNDLYQLTSDIDVSWEAKEAVEWSEAEQLISELKNMDGSDRAHHEGLTDILVYAHCVEDWDSGNVANWPSAILAALKKPISRHGYAQNSDGKFEVFNVPLFGDTDLIGVLENEVAAQALVGALNAPSPIDPLPSIITLADRFEEQHGGMDYRFSYVTFLLAAETREEASVTVLVPDDLLSDDEQGLVDLVYDACDGSEFIRDNEFWGSSALSRIEIEN